MIARATIAPRQAPTRRERRLFVALAAASFASCDTAPSMLPDAPVVQHVAPGGPTATPTATPPAAPAAPPTLAPPRPAYPPDRDADALAVGALEAITLAAKGPSLLARVDGREVLVTVATREAPQRWKPPVAYYRLARLLDAPVVPATALRAMRLSQLLEAADPPARAHIAQAAAVRPDGTVMTAVTALPPSTRRVGASWSLERASWEKRASTPWPAGDPPDLDGFASMLVLDLVSANLFRTRVEQGPGGELHLVHNESAFVERPDPEAIARQFRAVKRLASMPPALEAALARVTEATLDDALRTGEYDDWLVHLRAVRECHLRARAIATLLQARREMAASATP